MITMRVDYVNHEDSKCLQVHCFRGAHPGGLWVIPSAILRLNLVPYLPRGARNDDSVFYDLSKLDDDQFEAVVLEACCEVEKFCNFYGLKFVMA